MLYHLFKNAIYYFGKLFLIKEIRGLENLPKESCIIASNHVSYLDPPLIGAVIAKNMKRKIHFFAKIELFNSSITRVLYKPMESIYVDRRKKEDKSWLKASVKYLKGNHLIGIFPEGERSKNNRIGQGKTGAVRIALAARVPIVPISIIGTYVLMPMGKRLPAIKKIIKISIGKPLYYNKYYNRNVTKGLLRALTGNLMEKIRKLSQSSD